MQGKLESTMVTVYIYICTYVHMCIMYAHTYIHVCAYIWRVMMLLRSEDVEQVRVYDGHVYIYIGTYVHMYIHT